MTSNACVQRSGTHGGGGGGVGGGWSAIIFPSLEAMKTHSGTPIPRLKNITSFRSSVYLGVSCLCSLESSVYKTFRRHLHALYKTSLKAKAFFSFQKLRRPSLSPSLNAKERVLGSKATLATRLAKLRQGELHSPGNPRRPKDGVELMYMQLVKDAGSGWNPNQQ